MGKEVLQLVAFCKTRFQTWEAVLERFIKLDKVCFDLVTDEVLRLKRSNRLLIYSSQMQISWMMYPMLELISLSTHLIDLARRNGSSYTRSTKFFQYVHVNLLMHLINTMYNNRRLA